MSHQYANRRRIKSTPHEMLIVWESTGLRTSCRCGAIVGGQRSQDPVLVTLSDLLELVRIHSNEINYPK